MRRVLIVGNQTLSERRLLETLQTMAAEEPTTFHVVVPVTPLTKQEAALRHSEHVVAGVGESAAVALAQHRLRLMVRAMRELGLEVDGAIGAPSPMKAITAAMAHPPVDVVVISTLPKRLSRWLAADLPRKVERAFGVTVVHVTTDDTEHRTGHVGRAAAPFQRMLSR